MSNKPRYPVYVISKGRFENCLTAKFLVKDGVDFHLVVEPQEAEEYINRFGKERVYILPFSNLGLGSIPARNWVWEHAKTQGYDRHWILDDNITDIYRRYNRKRVRCNSGIALAAVEDFANRYENLAIAGLEYRLFTPDNTSKPPFYLNHRVYSCLLIRNDLSYRWRGRYNEDTDLCLQVLANGWCTALVCCFLIGKKATMTTKGGNATELYKGDGRLKMARSLERMWPGVVTVDRRFKRPQHVVDWSKFDTPLKLKPGVVIPDGPNEYGLELKQVKEIKSDTLRDWYERVTGDKNLAE